MSRVEYRPVVRALPYYYIVYKIRIKEKFIMLRPAITQIITKNESYYSLVIGVAKRARQITDELYQESVKENAKDTKENTLAGGRDFAKLRDDEPKMKKPVALAVDDFASGRYKIVEHKPQE